MKKGGVFSRVLLKSVKRESPLLCTYVPRAGHKALVTYHPAWAKTTVTQKIFNNDCTEPPHALLYTT